MAFEQLASELQQAQAALANGEVVLVPTDTVYGLAVAADNADAYQRLADLKGRSIEQPTAVLFASIAQLVAALPELSEPARRACEELLPGPYTLIVANSEHRFAHLCGTTPDAIGVRVPFHALDLPPIAATSANQHGEPEIREPADLAPELAQRIACSVDWGRRGARASTILKLVTWESSRNPDDIETIRVGDAAADIAVATLARIYER